MNVEERFRENEEEFYFAHITATYNLVSLLDDIEAEAIKESLMEPPDEKDEMRHQKIILLCELVKIFSLKKVGLGANVEGIMLMLINSGFR